MTTPVTWTSALWLVVFYFCGSPEAVLCRTAVSNTTVVKILVFYETHCRDSRVFVSQQLWPTYLKMSDHVKIQLVPFGLATKTENVTREGKKVIEIRCHHGPTECLGNMIQACAIRLTKTMYKRLGFVACMSSSDVPHRVAKTCANTVGIKWKEVDRCVHSTFGAQLLYEMGRRTWANLPKLTSVPSAKINGVCNATLLRRATTDLFGLVCSILGSHRPSVCMASPI